jgi:hypothetical protein
MIERSLVIRLISTTSVKLREWGDARLAAKGSAYVRRIARLQRKLVAREQDCAHLDKQLQVWQERVEKGSKRERDCAPVCQESTNQALVASSMSEGLIAVCLKSSKQ